MDVIHFLTSSTKISIFRALKKPMSPEELANSLRITRQGIDKHLKGMLKYGIVRKLWIISSGRPRVKFEASEMGMLFFNRLENFLSDYRRIGRESAIDELKNLDIRFIRGSIDNQAYIAEKEKIKSESSWFYSDTSDNNPKDHES